MKNTRRSVALVAMAILFSLSLPGLLSASVRPITGDAVALVQTRQAVTSATSAKSQQAAAQELAKLDRIAFICGRYEGVDERVAENLADREISVGDYVVSGGELPAAIMIDAITRLIPGALGNEASARQESFTSAEKAAKEGPDSTCDSGGLLDYPHYTRPADFRGIKVPDVLVGGNHEQIRRWRREKALEKTLRNRPDLVEKSGR